MNWLKNTLFNCREATYLIEKKTDSGITFKQNLQLYLHLLGCGMCKLYKRQSAVIQKLISDMMAEMDESGEIKLSDETKKRLQNEIDSRLKP